MKSMASLVHCLVKEDSNFNSLSVVKYTTKTGRGVASVAGRDQEQYRVYVEFHQVVVGTLQSSKCTTL
jgi:uncharacterized Zn finger protein